MIMFLVWMCVGSQIPENLSVLAPPPLNRTPPPVRDATTAANLTSAAAAAAARQQNSVSKSASGAGQGVSGVNGEDVDNSPEHVLWTVLGKKGMVVIKHGQFCH